MPSHIIVIPASTQSGRETICHLLASESKPFVRGIYRDASKAPASFVEQPNFEAARGDVSQGGLDFGGFDAVYYTPPPTYDGTDSGEFAERTANNIKDAIQRAASVKRLVLHSAVGAQNDHGIGILRLNYISDQILKAVVPEVIIIKPGYYYETWAAGALKSTLETPPRFISPMAPADYQIPMVSAKDVGKYSAKFLVDGAAKPGLQTVNLFGPRLYGSVDVKEALEQVTGKEIALEVVQKDELAGYFEQHVPKVYVQEFVDMHAAMLSDGIISKDFGYDEHTIRAEVELVDGLRDLFSQWGARCMDRDLDGTQG